MTAVAKAVLERVLQADFLPNVQARGEQLRTTLTALSAQFGLGEVRGNGLLLALDTGKHDATAITQACFHKGLLINAPQTHALRFMPALNVSAEEIAQMVAILAAVLAAT